LVIRVQFFLFTIHCSQFTYFFDFGLAFSEQQRHNNKTESEENEMYCPNCKAEYKPGFYECADCGVPLVYDLPPERPLTPEEERAASLVEVFSTYSQADVLLIKAFLNGEGIIYNFQGELFSGSGVFITPATLYVAKADLDRVREMLADHGIE